MSKDVNFSISIPADQDGYILLQCNHCGTFFKITVDDYNDESSLNLYCPACGLVSDNYLTEDVIELVSAMTDNYAMDLIYDTFKSMERKTRHNASQVKAGNRPPHIEEHPIKTGIDALAITDFRCCNKSVKVEPLLKMVGCYCPFCGVKDYETE